MKTPVATSTPVAVTQEEIAQRAREIWLSRGSPEGQDVEIWLLAERELRPLPAVTAATATPKASRKARATTPTKPTGDSNTIEVANLQERLDEFGTPPQRSPTSLDLS